MREQDTYEIASFITHNQEAIVKDFRENMSTDDIKNFVIYKVVDNFRDWPVDYVISCFEDERVLLVFDFYYIQKRGEYEHAN